MQAYMGVLNDVILGDVYFTVRFSSPLWIMNDQNNKFSLL